jgi:hypothetical protein
MRVSVLSSAAVERPLEFLRADSVLFNGISNRLIHIRNELYRNGCPTKRFFEQADLDFEQATDCDAALVRRHLPGKGSRSSRPLSSRRNWRKAVWDNHFRLFSGLAGATGWCASSRS